MKPKRVATRAEIRRAAGQLILCGFQGREVSAELREILREVQPAGLIYFARNIESPEQLCELGREIKELQPSLLLSIDQEGGRVARVRAPATEWPTMREVGQTNDPKLARRVGAALARELRAMNIDVDFAPVLDVDTNPKNPVIGDRSFAREPERVAELGTALALGLQENGVAACGKHFPGHGDTDLDSHLALPHVGHDPDRLRAVEWLPFRRAIAAGLSSVMTAHVVVEALDPELPATLSPKALAPLRRELGFNGVIISDDLEMKAVADHFQVEQMARMGLTAGVDLFLVCHTPEKILGLYRAIVVAAEQEELDHGTLLDAADRVSRWRTRYALRPSSATLVRTVVGCAAHRALAEEIRERAASNV